VSNGKKTIHHVIQHLAVELKADTVRILDRAANTEPQTSSEAADQDDVPS
jgi:hypothetical protein